MFPPPRIVPHITLNLQLDRCASLQVELVSYLSNLLLPPIQEQMCLGT